MLRTISVALREFQALKESKRTFKKVKVWQKDIDQLPQPQRAEKRLLIIRLDDIGDYILFRNTLEAYTNCARWRNYKITLLGNIAWRELFEFSDSDGIDEVIWLNKKEYFGNGAYRKEIWNQLRSTGFQSVVCPSRVRPLLLDDMCMKAAAPEVAIGGANDFKWDSWNRASDILYNELFRNEALCHELLYNRNFANWCCKSDLRYTRTHLTLTVENKCESAYLICFAGASVKSRQWPVENWIEFIKTYSKLADAPAIVLAGGPGDIPFIDQIVAATDVESIAGKVNLIEMAGWIKHAEATISNDTMAAHLSVALNRPTVMVCSGDNFFKFSAYRDAGVSGVVSLFPEAFEKEWRKKGKKNFRNYMAVSRDIGTIQPEAVQAALQSLIISG